MQPTSSCRLRKGEHCKAAHHCSACRPAILTQKQYDGEPAGTAGAPMLEVLKQRQLTNLAAVVRPLLMIKLAGPYSCLPCVLGKL